MKVFTPFVVSLLLLCLHLGCWSSSSAQGVEGYYRYPSVHGETVVFAAEGDLWSVSLNGGLAQRLTTHPEDERFPIISPDGQTLAFSASYEGPTEIYTMPITGGLPTRWTYENDASNANTWTPDGKVVYDTRAYSTLPDRQLVRIDPTTKEKTRIPLSQASEASFDASGETVYFVRPSYHGNVTKRYQGGTARQIWKFSFGSEEAIRLSTGYPGESHHPMWYEDRVYFITDRDGVMNIWSMDTQGQDLTQHTHQLAFDVRYAKLSEGNIVYQAGADIWHYHIPSQTDKKINIRLATDLDQLREKWVQNPASYLTSAHPDPTGERVVLTARGRVFIAPVESGRMVSFPHKEGVRYRDAVFSPDGKHIIALSDESGEFEFVKLPADGVGTGQSLTTDGQVLRYQGVPSPDGKWLAYDDLANRMYILNVATGVSKLISTNEQGIYDFSWSPDSKWLAFVQEADNTMAQIYLHGLETEETFPITTDRANSVNPRWSPDGKFIYFLSDRSFTTLVGSPWGSRQPEPYFDAPDKLYHIALQAGTRSPFRPQDEFVPNKRQGDEEDEEERESKKAAEVVIDRANMISRMAEVPIKAGNYSDLAVGRKAIFLLSRETGLNAKTHLMHLKVDNEDVSLKPLLKEVNDLTLTANGKKLFVRKGKKHYLIPSKAKSLNDLSDYELDLSGWKFSMDPREDWRQIFTDAWRMERDYFYDANMHGVDWQAMHDKYYPLVDRVTTRNELSDLIGRFVGELSALHTSVRGGDEREDELDVSVASLGARFKRNEGAGGFEIEHIYQADPDYPHERAPLDDPYLDVQVGDVITSINGQPALGAADIGAHLRNQAGKQVRLEIKRDGVKREFIVEPIANSYALRYRDWEYSRRLAVEKQSDSQIGYVHLQAMGRRDLNQWYREFYPVFDRPGLIIDVRHNRGGNIESFILEKLLRKAWMYWKSRSGKPYWNMQYAFRGHIVILVDRLTASDGEAFADGFKKLNLGTAIGTRTWGGEIWLSSANRLTDGGLARAPMMGVYGPNGEWLIEGHGFEPDIVVDNLPHATFNGQDTQLDAAIEHLQKLIAEDPREVPQPPAYPDKSFDYKR